MQDHQVIIYETEQGVADIKITLENDTLWLTQRQMAELFDKDTDTIGLHVRNIYADGELSEPSTTEEFPVVQLEGKRSVKRKVKHYNLDVIISVGYRVNSRKGTQFRIWAGKVLKEYLANGYAINERRLSEQADQFAALKQTVRLLGNVLNATPLSNDEASGLLKVITDYTYALDVLDKYDHGKLILEGTHNFKGYIVSYDEAMEAIQGLRKKFGGSSLFGNEKDESFRSSIATIYQSFDSKDLYPSIEEKAANLLYFIVKNHSFSDGNKRIAAFLFVWFMEKNGLLYRNDGSKRIADNALVALTLMIAESKPEEKDVMTQVVVNLINERNS